MIKGSQGQNKPVPANPNTEFDKVYWMRIVLGVVAGVGAEFVFGLDYIDGILLAVIGYLGSYYIARWAWFRKLDPAKVRKIYTTGIGSYIMLFLFTYILLFTLSLPGMGL